jgi:RND family efflux transporter MFP subunit
MRLRSRGVLVMMVVAGTLAAAGLRLIATQAAEPPAKPVPVRIAVAAPASHAGDIRATGTLLFKREMTLGFKVAGILKSFAADSGDAVKKDDVLARLDPTEVGARNRDAQAMVDNAEANLKRAEDLAAKGFAAQAKVDDAKMAVERARASRDAMAFDAAKAELRAPADGVVLSRLAEPNEVVTPGKPILLFGDASGGLVLVTPVSDTQITRIRGGDAAVVRFAGLTPIKASVARLAAKADERTGSFDVELKLDQISAGLRSGLVGEARITPSLNDRLSTYLAIPAIALLEGRGDRAAVFIVDKAGKAQRRSVRVGGFLDELVLIAEGLQPGDRVVTSGAPYLRNGQAVVIVRDAKDPPAS